MAEKTFRSEAITSLDDLRNKIWMQNGQQVPSIFRVASYMGFILDSEHSTPEQILLKRPGIKDGVEINAYTGLFNCSYNNKHYSGDVFDLTNLFPQYFIRFYDEAKEQFERVFLSKKENNPDDLSKRWSARWFSMQCYRWFQIIVARDISTKLELQVNRLVATYEAEKQKMVEKDRQVAPAKSAAVQTNNGRKKFESKPIREYLKEVLPDSELRIETWLKRMGFVLDHLKSSVNSHVYRAGDQKIIVMTDPYRCFNDRSRKGYLDIVSLSYSFQTEFAMAMNSSEKDPTRMWHEYGKRFDINGTTDKKTVNKEEEAPADENRMRFNNSRYTYTGSFYDPDTKTPYESQALTYLTRYRSIPTTAIDQLNEFMGVVYDELETTIRTGADAFGMFYNDYYWDAEQCQAYTDLFQDTRTLKRPNLKEKTVADLKQRIEKNKQIIQQGMDKIGAALTEADKQKKLYIGRMMEKLSESRSWPVLAFPVVKIPKEVKVLHETVVDGNKVQRREYSYTKPKALEDMECCGYELKARGMKHNAARTNTTEGVWMACKVPFADVRRVFFFESALDAMSFIEVDRRLAEAEKRAPRFDINQDMLVSIAGQFSTKQGYTVKRLVPQAEVYACFDMDTAGRRYAYELNNVWSKQTIRETKVDQLVDAVEVELGKVTPQYEKKLADEGYKRAGNVFLKDTDGKPVCDEKGNAIEMARFERHELKHAVFIGDKQAIMSMNDISIMRVREQLPQYELALKILQPIKAEYEDYDLATRQLIPKTVKDWNDRLVCDKWEKTQQIKNLSNTAGKVRQAEDKKQQEIDDRINKANERIAQRGGQGGDSNERKNRGKSIS